MGPRRGVPISPVKLGRTTLVAILALALGAGSAQAEAEFSTRGDHWNGLRRFTEIADEESVAIHVTENLDAHALESSEAVILLHVEPSRSIGRLATFVERGGALVI